MGSDETAITIPGALEKLTFFTGTGRHRVQIIYFFWMQIGPRTPTGVVLIVGSHLHRMRFFFFRVLDLTAENNPPTSGRKKHCP